MRPATTRAAAARPPVTRSAVGPTAASRGERGAGWALVLVAASLLASGCATERTVAPPQAPSPPVVDEGGRSAAPVGRHTPPAPSARPEDEAPATRPEIAPPAKPDGAPEPAKGRLLYADEPERPDAASEIALVGTPDGDFTTAPSIELRGSAPEAAHVTANGHRAEREREQFRVSVPLDPGPNRIRIVASLAGEVLKRTIVVTRLAAELVEGE
jgi:hypothetical protein